MYHRDGEAPPAPTRLAYSPDDAAIAVGRPRSRIFQAIKDGELEARKDGRSVIIEATELLRWIQTMPVRNRDANRPPLPATAGASA
jgi:excisionase family DNA binding protein